jgi:hypothetical protein
MLRKATLPAAALQRAALQSTIVNAEDLLLLRATDAILKADTWRHGSNSPHFGDSGGDLCPAIPLAIPLMPQLIIVDIR